MASSHGSPRLLLVTSRPGVAHAAAKVKLLGQSICSMNSNIVAVRKTREPYQTGVLFSFSPCLSPGIKKIQHGLILTLPDIFIAGDPKTSVEFSENALIMILAGILLSHFSCNRQNFSRYIGRLLVGNGVSW